MPSVVVKMCASTMLTPHSARHPPTFMNRPGMVCGVEQHLGPGPKLVDAEIDRQRRPLGVGRADDLRMAQMLVGR